MLAVIKFIYNDCSLQCNG